MSKSAKARSGRRRPRKPRPARSPPAAEHEYSQAELRRLFQLPPRLIRALSQAGFITAAAPRGRTRYSFQDLLVLRMAGSLKSAQVPSAQITAAFANIRTLLPPGAPMSSLAVAATGRRVAVREGAQVWEAHSGQYSLPLQHEPVSPRVGAPRELNPKLSRREQAEEWYLKAYALEESDPTQARGAYTQALDLYPQHPEARINLGRLLHLAGELAAAERVYGGGERTALLAFNQGILLEDLGRDEEAVAAYREALALDPLTHDAHFNLARLHEKANRPHEALRHLLAYRRHVATYGDC